MLMHITRLLLLVLLCLAGSSVILAQRMDYTDSWMVASEGSASVVGSAITDEPYTNYGHEYIVTATLSDDLGRSSIGASGGGSCGTGNIQCSRVDVSLAMLTTSAYCGGQYYLDSIHEGYCPYYAMNLSQVEMEIPLLVGISVTVLTKSAIGNIYTKITNCNVNCPVDEYISGNNKGQYIQAVVPWVYFYGYQCAPVSGFYPGTVASQCRDIAGVVNLPFPVP